MTDQALERTLRRSVVEGVLYAIMAGLAEVYMIADAVRLGASTLEVVLVSTLPLLVGSLGALAAVRLIARRVRRRTITTVAVLVQAAVLLALALGDALGASSPTSLLVLATAYHGVGQAAGTAWSSWMGDLVPVARRGSYFAHRNRFVHLATFLGLLAGGLTLQAIEPAGVQDGSGGGGFALLFGAACVFRLGSAWLLAASHEPRFAGFAPGDGILRYMRSPDGAAARRIVPLAGAFLFATAIASPLFAPFMLKVLGFDYGEYMTAQAVLVAVKLAALPAWGRAVDRHGPRQVYGLAAVLAAAVPLPWLWVSGVPAAVAAEGWSGLAWGAYEVSLFTLMLDSATPRQRPFLFAANSVVSGAGQVAGGLLGVLLLGPVGLGFRGVFLTSLCARLALGLFAPRLLGPIGTKPPLGRRQLVLRLIGLRTNSGANVRPVDEPIEPER